MASRAERLTSAFYAWELRGRGWQAYEEPVELEPPFRPFLEHRAPRRAQDEGRRETLLSTLADRFFGRRLAARPEEVEEPAAEPEPEIFRPKVPLVEITVSLPPGVSVTPGLTQLPQAPASKRPIWTCSGS